MSTKPPLIVLRDNQEKVDYFTFASLKTRNGQPLVVQEASLGPRNGDYTVLGMIGQCAVERKSIADCVGTVLGWGERRERFDRELENLEQMETSAVVVVGTQDEVETWILQQIEHGEKSNRQRVKEFAGAVRAIQQDFRVPWIWCSSQRRAEIETLRILERHFEHNRRKGKRLTKAERQAIEAL